MKIINVLATICLFAVPSLAQGISIGYPQDGASIPAGSTFTVEVDRPDTLTGSTEVAIAIDIQSCSSGHCLPPQDLLGPVLYHGSYDPQFHSEAPGFKPPHQNYSVSLPPSISKGLAQLSVTHFRAGPFPLFEIKNVTLNIV